MSDVVIETHALTRYFGRHCALDGVSLRVPRGSVFALLGRNGSGKSTLIQILLNLLTPTRGTSSVFGEDSRRLSPATLARVGYAPENHPLPASLKVSDVHAFQRSYYRTWDDALFATVLDHFGLSPAQKIGHLSRGQRAGLAMALVMAPRPELLVMDDPSLGLDPVARRTLLEAMLLTTRQRGTTVFFTSHLLDDVERAADHIAILDRSVLRVSCTMETLRSCVKRFALSVAPDAAAPLLVLPGLLQSRREGPTLLLTIANADEDVLRQLRTASAGQLEEVPLTLEDSVVGYLGDTKHQVSLFDRTRPSAEVA
ncbi:MAG TPA: ABC transporter ATP-binding protein [Tepidisphaeraceae bacterium]|jgi:ABC-2 type transport system ATP-binding protein